MRYPIVRRRVVREEGNFVCPVHSPTGSGLFEPLAYQVFNEDFIGTLEGLPSVGNEFCYDSVVFQPAGGGSVLAEVVGFSVNSDKSPAGGFVKTVLGELFSFVGHRWFLKNKVSFDTF